MARDGAVGKATFEQVEALTKQGKTKTEAFEQIASDTGRNRGTVAANYYRVARASGALKPRKRRGKATKTASSSRARTSRACDRTQRLRHHEPQQRPGQVCDSPGRCSEAAAGGSHRAA